MFRPLLAAVAAALVFAAPAAAAPYDDAAYWAFADRSQQTQFDDRWDEQAGYYRMGGGGVEPMANSMLLLGAPAEEPGMPAEPLDRLLGPGKGAVELTGAVEADRSGQGQLA